MTTRKSRTTASAQDGGSEKKASKSRARPAPAKTSAKTSSALAAAVHEAVAAPERAADDAALQGSMAAVANPPSPEALRRMIAEAAYYRAERRGFVPGGEELDWFEAEAEVREKHRR